MLRGLSRLKTQMVVIGVLVSLSITNKTPASLCAVSFLPTYVWCEGTEMQWSVGLFSAVFGSICFLINVSGRKLVGFNKEINSHG